MPFIDVFPAASTKSPFAQASRHDLELFAAPQWIDGDETSHMSRKRRLRRVFASAQLALGKRMFTAGIDDDGLCEQIAAIDRALSNPFHDEEPFTTSLRIQRRRLLRRLADAALEFDAPLPGADEEFADAFKAKRALAKHRARFNSHEPMMSGTLD